MNLLKKIIALALLLSPFLASATEYNQLQQAQSTLTFGYKQMGVPMEGKFGQFAAQLSFDPAKLAGARAHIDVALASIDTGSQDANESIAGKLWFNTRLYPLGSFVSTGIKALGGNRYQITGKLTLKGQTREVSAPVTFKTDGNQGSFDGSFNIKRLDYGIGIGEWTDLDTVADDVQIRFHFTVLAAPASPLSNPLPRKKP